MIRIVVLAWLPMIALAQRFPVGPTEFDVDAEGIVVLYHGHDWRPDISQLPIRAEDCQDAGKRRECKAHPGAACLACLSDWKPVAWDELNEVIYISAFLGTRIVLGYDLRSDQIRRVVDGYPAGFEGARAVSPLGRYLVAAGHADCSSSRLLVVDTEARSLRILDVPGHAEGDTVQVTGVRWIDPVIIEYSAEIHRQSECRQGVVKPLRLITGKLDVSAKTQSLAGRAIVAFNVSEKLCHFR